VQEVQPKKKSEDFKLEEEVEDNGETPDEASNENVDSSDSIFDDFLNK